jgi:hypothetical protein
MLASGVRSSWDTDAIRSSFARATELRQPLGRRVALDLLQLGQEPLRLVHAPRDALRPAGLRGQLEHLDALAHDLAHQLVHAGVGDHRAMGGVQQHHAVRRRLDQLPAERQPLDLGLRRPGVRRQLIDLGATLHALRQVAHERGHHRLSGQVDAHQGELDRQLAAIGALGWQLHATPHQRAGTISSATSTPRACSR